MRRLLFALFCLAVLFLADAFVCNISCSRRSFPGVILATPDSRKIISYNLISYNPVTYIPAGQRCRSLPAYPARTPAYFCLLKYAQ